MPLLSLPGPPVAKDEYSFLLPNPKDGRETPAETGETAKQQCLPKSTGWPASEEEK